MECLIVTHGVYRQRPLKGNHLLLRAGASARHQAAVPAAVVTPSDGMGMVRGDLLGMCLYPHRELGTHWRGAGDGAPSIASSRGALHSRRPSLQGVGPCLRCYRVR